MLHPFPRPGTVRLVPALALLAGMVLLGGAAPTVGNTPTTTRDDAQPGASLALAALPLLRAAISAERRLGYAGTLAEQSPGREEWVSSVRHTAGSPGLQMQAGAGWAWTPGGSPMLTGAALALLAAHYRLVVSGVGSVLGEPAYEVCALRVDGRPAAEIWIDQATMLPLRAELLDDRGREVSAMGFVRLDRAIGRAGIVPAVERWTTSQLTAEVALPEADLAPVPRVVPPATLPVPGWTHPGRLWPHMSLIRVQRLPGAGGSLLDLSYSDGAFSLSLFLQRGVLSARDLGTWTRQRVGGTTVWAQGGPLRRTAWQDGAYVITVVTDAPDSGEEALVAAAVHQLSVSPAPPGLAHRLRRGLDRMGSWFNPFH